MLPPALLPSFRPLPPLQRTNNVLKELLIDPDHVAKGKKIGSGAFGDVYKGEYMGQVRVDNITCIRLSVG